MDWSPIIAVGLGLATAWIALVAVLWLVRPRSTRLRDLISMVPDLLRLVRALLADPASPLGVRLALLLLLVWLLSPIDLIPEFVPVLGPLDDVVVAVIVLRYVRRRLGVEALQARWSGSAVGFELLLRLVGEG